MATTLADRLKRVRKAAGYGEHGQAAEFARLVGISPPSLHNLESGRSTNTRKSLAGYIKVGANPKYILDGVGPVMLKNIEKNLRAQTLVSQIMELDDDEIDILETMAKKFIRAKPDPSENDPFKRDPPKGKQ